MQKRYLLPFIFILFIISCQDEEPAPEVYVSDFYPEFYGIDIIKSVTPDNGETDVDIFAEIEVDLNLKIYEDRTTDIVFEKNILYDDEIFKINDVNKIKTHHYRIILDTFFVAENTGTILSGIMQWNETGTRFTYSFPELLPGGQSIDIRIKTHIEELTDEGWTQLIYLDGKEAIYNEAIYNNTYSFACIEEADTIISTNILTAYPEDNMLNLYKDEYPEGGIKLFKAQTKCFELGPNETSFVRFTSTDTTFTFDYTVQTLSEGGQLIRFPLPEALEHEKIYKMELVRSNTVSKAEKLLYSLFFRVSMYKTLEEKIDNSAFVYRCDGIINKNGGMYIFKKAKIKNIELFDSFEVENMYCISGFIGVWYVNYIYPLIYEHANELQELGFVYPSTISGFSVPPLDAAYIQQYHKKDNSLENNIVKFPEEAFLVNNGEYVFYQDYREVANFCSNLLNTPDLVISDVLNEYCINITKKWGFPGFGTTDFSVTLQYYIPAFDYYGTKSRTIWVDNEALNE